MTSASELNNRYSGVVLSKRFIRYFFPSVITAVALSLSEFVDSILVSNLLDSNALAIVSVGNPIVLIMSTMYSLIGRGGAILYSESMGKHDEKSASSYFTTALIFALVSGLVLMSAGLSFIKPLANLLCPGLTLGGDLIDYIRVLVVSMPFMITAMTVVFFLPAAGNPNIGMTVNIVANVLNLIFDYVFINIFHMGVSGAAWATLVSFCIAFMIVIVLILRKKVRLKLARPNGKCFASVGKISEFGFASALSQIGFALKFGYCNSAVTLLGGNDAIIAMSLCQQTLSIVSIFLMGVCETIVPFVSMMRAQMDFGGTRHIMRKAIRITFILSAICVVAFEAFPEVIAAIYNVVDKSAVDVSVRGIRIYSFCYLFRSLAILFMFYVNAIKKVKYATAISLFDGAVGIIPIGMILTHFIGLDGIWLTFTLDSFLLLSAIFVINLVISKKSKGKYSGIFLLENPDPDVKVLNLSFSDENADISSASIEIEKFCLENGMEAKLSRSTGLAVEEMAIYTKGHADKKTVIDLVLQICRTETVIDFRSTGRPFDPLSVKEDDSPENMKLLHSIAKKIEYVYTLGMNSTKLTIGR